MLILWNLRCGVNELNPIFTPAWDQINGMDQVSDVIAGIPHPLRSNCDLENVCSKPKAPRQITWVGSTPISSAQGWSIFIVFPTSIFQSTQIFTNCAILPNILGIFYFQIFLLPSDNLQIFPPCLHQTSNRRWLLYIVIPSCSPHNNMLAHRCS